MPEVELKFALDPQDREAFGAAAPLAGTRPTRKRTLNLYFDTRDARLARAGMALRLRSSDGRWSQALKGASSGRGGLHAREEWEFDRPGPHLDLALFAATPLAGIEGAERLHRDLAAVFRVDFQRRAWLLEPAPGNRLEVVLDEGRVACGERSEPICEVEIECLEGDAGAAFDLAARLLETVALRPSAITKAARGYRLFRRQRLRPVKAGSVALDAAMAPIAAARAIVASGLEQLQANEEGVLGTRDPEFVHQARVALRRMRSALRMFRTVIGEARAQAWHDELAEVAAALGVARDADVFATESLPAVLRAYGDAALGRRLAARAARLRAPGREAARAALRSARYARVILDLARWLAQADAAADASASPALAQFATHLVRRRHRRLVRAAHALGTLTAAQRHDVRIAAKRLRYGVDGLAAVFPRKRVHRYLAALSDLQDALGRANDAASASRLLDELAAPEAFAAFARGWFAALAQPDTVLLDALVARLRRRRCWRGSAPAAG